MPPKKSSKTKEGAAPAASSKGAATKAVGSSKESKKRTAAAEPESPPARKSARVRPKVEYNEDKLAKAGEDEEPTPAQKGKSIPSSVAAPSPGQVLPKRMPVPKRSAVGELMFPDYPEFRPNLTPKEVLQMGSFGGTYFRSIKSSVTGKTYGADQWKEFPADWFEGLNINAKITSQTYREPVNTYKVNCGGDLYMWESSGWINACDPYGWFQWYCRFYLGRRTTDDERQVGRGLRCMGTTGRWRIRLCNMIAQKGKKFDDPSVSPVIRQTLQHWGFKLTEPLYLQHCKKYGYKA